MSIQCSWTLHDVCVCARQDQMVENFTKSDNEMQHSYQRMVEVNTVRTCPLSPSHEQIQRQTYSLSHFLFSDYDCYRSTTCICLCVCRKMHWRDVKTKTRSLKLSKRRCRRWSWWRNPWWQILNFRIPLNSSSMLTDQIIPSHNETRVFVGTLRRSSWKSALEYK